MRERGESEQEHGEEKVDSSPRALNFERKICELLR